ncbi:MAG TPA: hypothetical protein DDW65_04870 [Firmicutes bacterium]|jgi:hypothetical protein|nr:hypothetical protein [Bacillota bacterium]
MADVTFEIKDYLLVLSTGMKGWTKEVNVVSWNKRKPKLDIREWDENHIKMGKGITLNREEIIQLKELFNKLDLDEHGID